MASNSTPEIQVLEEGLGFKLPLAYCEYVIRHRSESPIVGTDCAPRHVLRNTELLPELLIENNIDLQLPEQLVCFMMHQGYIAAWFDAQDGDDPTCWFFSEGTTTEPIREAKFSSFMENLIRSWS